MLNRRYPARTKKILGGTALYRSALSVLTVCWLAVPVRATVSEDGEHHFRERLQALFETALLVQPLSPDNGERLLPGDVPTAAEIESLTSEELALLQADLERSAIWRSFTARSGAPAAPVSWAPVLRERLAEMASVALEEARSSGNASELLRVEQAAHILETASDEELARFVTAAVRAHNASGGDRVSVSAADTTCGTDSFAGILACLTDIGADLVDFFDPAVPGSLPTLIVELGPSVSNAIATGWQRALELAIDDLGVPGIAADVAEFVGLPIDTSGWDDVSAADVDLSAVDTLCPLNGLDIPEIGRVGSIEGYYQCRLNVEWPSRTLSLLIPKAGVILKVAKGVSTALAVVGGALCDCYERAVFVNFWDDHLDALDATDQFLDRDVSSLASASTLAATSGELGVAELQVAGSQARADGLLADLLRHNSRQSELSQQLLAYLDGELETRILDDLANRRENIARFVLPETLGGLQEEVSRVAASLVENLIRAGGDGSRATTVLAAADGKAAEGDYLDAYFLYQDTFREVVRALGDFDDDSDSD